jgi:hypothetical protein
MQNINIEKKDDSPKVIMDFENGLMEFEGECYPENAFEFFEPIIEWLNNYLEDKSKDTTINFKLSYFNSATTQVLFDIFDILDESEHTSLQINWYYDENNKGTLKDYEEFSEEFEDLNLQAIKL